MFLAVFCDCTGQFVSDLFWNHIVDFPTRRLKYKGWQRILRLRFEYSHGTIILKGRIEAILMVFEHSSEKNNKLSFQQWRTQTSLHSHTSRNIAGLKLERAISRKMIIKKCYRLSHYIIKMAYSCKRKGPFWKLKSNFANVPFQNYPCRSMLEAWNFGLKKKRSCSICVAKTKTLTSCAVTDLCIFIFAYARCLFSYVAAHLWTELWDMNLAVFRCKTFIMCYHVLA